MSDCVVRIDKLANGYEVEMTDPKIVEANNKRDNSTGGKYTPWKDPKVGYVFKTVDEVVGFLTKALPTAMPVKDDYSTSFDSALGESDD